MATDLKHLTRLFCSYFSAGDLDAIERELLDEEINVHFPGLPGPIDRSAYRQLGQDYLTAFPGCRLEVVDQLQEGRCVVTRTLLTGTHSGPLMGIPATGRAVTLPGCMVDYYNESGRLGERYEYVDMLLLMAQLGVLPVGSAAGEGQA